MGESRVLEMGDERLGQFAIAEGFAGGLFFPRTEMDFIDAHGRAQGVAFLALIEPGLVRPLDFAVFPNEGGVLGGNLEEKAEGYGLESHASLARAGVNSISTTLHYIRSKTIHMHL